MAGDPAHAWVNRHPSEGGTPTGPATRQTCSRATRHGCSPTVPVVPYGVWRWAVERADRPWWYYGREASRGVGHPCARAPDPCNASTRTGPSPNCPRSRPGAERSVGSALVVEQVPPSRRVPTCSTARAARSRKKQSAPWTPKIGNTWINGWSFSHLFDQRHRTVAVAGPANGQALHTDHGNAASRLALSSTEQLPDANGAPSPSRASYPHLRRMASPSKAADLQAFLSKWELSGAAERANAHLFITDLCDILRPGAPTTEAARRARQRLCLREDHPERNGQQQLHRPVQARLFRTGNETGRRWCAGGKFPAPRFRRRRKTPTRPETRTRHSRHQGLGHRHAEGTRTSAALRAIVAQGGDRRRPPALHPRC